MPGRPDAPLALDTIVFARRLRSVGRRGPRLVDVDLEILPGEVFVIIGRARAGKTALVESFVGLRPVQADQLSVCGADPMRFPLEVKERLGVAVGRAGVERGLRVAEALRLFSRFYSRPTDPDRLLDILHLRGLEREPVHRLPAWGAQLFSLALALVNDPIVLVADEPTRDLDPTHAQHIARLLADRRAKGLTTIMTSNNLDEAERLADRVCLLDAGRVLAVETPQALIARGGSPLRIVFEVRKRAVALDALAELPGVTAAHADGETYIVASRDGFATLRGLIRYLERQGVEPASLRLAQPTLRDAVLELLQAGDAQ